MPERTYLDVASAAPWHPAALEAHAAVAASLPADPARRHEEGRAARDLLERARFVLADAVGGTPERLVLTSGGTEAVHLAIRGSARADAVRPRRILSAAVEHSAALAAARDSRCEAVEVPVDADGRVDLDALEAALRDGGALLVNVQHANHEVGTLQPVAEAAALAHAHGALLHVDACQTVGRLPVDLADLGADLLTFSAAKLGGARGVGAVAWGPDARLAAVQTGDEREHRRRAGLEDLPGVAATAEALLQLAPGDPDGAAAREAQRADALRRRVRVAARDAVEDLEVHGPDDGTLPHLLACSALYVDGEALVAGLDAAGFAVHSGSSCATTSGEPSHVLVARRALTHGHVRASFGPEVGVADLDRFVQALASTVADLRRRLGRLDRTKT